jgi:alkylation response protein AidB-like acyl-CoA dehydrogenase
MTDATEELRASVRNALRYASRVWALRPQTTPPIADLDLLSTLADIGLFGLGIPEQRGGSGGTMTDLAAAVEECGAVLAPAPLLGSLMAARMLSTASSEAAGALLKAVAAGSLRAAVATPRSDKNSGLDQITARSQGDEWRLQGRLGQVIDGCEAQVVLVPAVTSTGLALLAVQSVGYACSNLPAVDLTRQLARLDFQGAPAQLIAAPGQWNPDHYRDQTLALLSADAVGGATAVLDLTVKYAKTRHQFGRPIGSFQAVKHRCADMATALQSARVALDEALRVLDQNDPQAALYCAVAKLTCGEAYVAITEQAIQIFGGIGFTWEHEAQRYFKRAHADNVLAGDRRTHWPRIAAMIEV